VKFLDDKFVIFEKEIDDAKVAYEYLNLKFEALATQNK